jgi:hypothetical protein
MSKKIISLTVIAIMLFTLCACQNHERHPRDYIQMGNFYGLGYAYDNGLITKADLKAMAKTLPVGVRPEGFSEESEIRLREEFLEVFVIPNAEYYMIDEADLVIDHISAWEYYGIYNGYVAVRMDHNFWFYVILPGKIVQTVEGVKIGGIYANNERVMLWYDESLSIN